MNVRYRNFILDTSRNFIFAYVPKVACTNWKALMRYMAGYDDWLDNRLAHDRVRSGLHFLETKGADAALVERDDVPKYAMVRDPYTRTLSAYINKVEKRLPPKPEGEGDFFDTVVRTIDAWRAENMSYRDRIDYEVFLTWVREDTSAYVGDEHWAPQSVLLRQPNTRFNILGRFETLKADSARMLAAMGCDRGFPSQQDVKFPATRAAEKLALYYTPATRELVNVLFADDFVNFQYVMAPPSGA